MMELLEKWMNMWKMKRKMKMKRILIRMNEKKIKNIKKMKEVMKINQNLLKNKILMI
jgi:hypothetical protein